MSVRFDAAGEHYANASPQTGSLHTFVFWGRIASGTGEQGFMGYSQSATVGTTGAVGIVRQASGNLVVDVANVGASIAGACATGTWYAIAVVRTSATAGTVYFGTDPTSLTATAVDFTSATTAPITLTIGNWTYNSWLNGNIAGFRQYAAALTADEVASELAQYQPVRVANLVRHHPFIAAETVDYSGNANTLTGGSGATTEDGPPIRWARSRGPRVTLSTAPAQQVDPAAIGTAEAFGVATLTAGPVAVAPTSIPTAEAFGTPQVNLAVTPTSIPSAEAFGTPTILVQGVIAPASISSAEAFGTPSLIYPQNVAPTAVPSGEAFGTGTVSVGPVSLAPTSIPTGEAFGTATVSLTVFAASISSTEAFGTATLTAGPVTVTVTAGIPTGEAFGLAALNVTLDPTGRIRPNRARLTPLYELLVVARIPQQSGPPMLLDVDPIEWSSLTWSSTLSRPQALTVKALKSSITEPVAQRLRDPDRLPTELHLLRNGKRVFAGPLDGGSEDERTLTLVASGLLAYLERWIVVADMRFDQVDQFSIAASLVDQWQALEFGHYGIDTSTVGASGRLRDQSYVREEIHWVDRRVQELGARRDGFDAEVDPTTRKLQLWYPGKGLDRSTGEDAVIFDDRNADAGGAIFSVGPGDLASDAYGSGSSAGGESTLWSEQANLDLRAAYGRSATAGSWSDVSRQDTLDDHVAALRDARDRPLRAPGRRVEVTTDSDLDSYSEGDTVSYRIDSLLNVDGAYRIRSRTVSVAETGVESVDLEFV